MDEEQALAFPAKRTTIMRHKFQSIYKRVGNLREAIDWMDDMHTYGKTSAMQRPPVAIFSAWADQVDAGDADVPPKIEQQVQEMLDRRPQWAIHDLNRANIAAAKAIAQHKIDGKPVTPVEVAYFNNAIGSNAAAITALRNGEPRQKGDTYQIGRLNINAGPRPAKRLAGGEPQRQRGAKSGINRQKPVEAEFRMVDD